MARLVFYLICMITPFIVFTQTNYIDHDGLKQGEWKLYFPYTNDSIISEQGRFINDLEDGLWVKYHDNGQVRELAQYQEGKLSGCRISINKKGKLNEQEFFLNGKYHGVQLYFHETSKKKLEVNYVDGIKEGYFISYYKNGKMQEHVYYMNDQKNGRATWYFDTEQVSMQYEYDKGMIIDTAYAYYKTGKLKTTYVYENNKLNGEKTTYYPSGLIKEKGSFKDDVKHGVWCSYDSIGYETNCITYRNGIIK